MTKGTKIIIVILAMLVIGLIVFGIVNNNLNENKTNEKKDELTNIREYINKIDEKDTQISPKNEAVENEISKENQINNENNIGKEEQESNNDNTELDNKQKAIKLAQEEWGISISSYNFEAELQSDKTYKVTVRNKTGNLNTIAIYIVDVNNGNVKDITE